MLFEQAPAVVIAPDRELAKLCPRLADPPPRPRTPAAVMAYGDRNRVGHAACRAALFKALKLPEEAETRAIPTN